MGGYEMQIGRALNGASWSVTAILLGAATSTPVLAQSVDLAALQPQTTSPLRTEAPPGFEDLAERTESLFDLNYQGRRIGSFRAIVEQDFIRFADPQEVVEALGPGVDREEVLALLSQPLPTNQRLVCQPGQTEACGFLPPDTAGVVVNLQLFTVELFLTRLFLIQQEGDIEALGPPMSGFSLIQNALVSASATTAAGDSFRFGGTFDTLASVGRTAVVAQTVVDDDRGARLQQGYVQHIWNRYVGAAGLFTNFDSILLTSYQLLGAQFQTFEGTRSSQSAQWSSPIEVVLPRTADVEIYRNGVLIATRRYEAGLQLIDTNSFPPGSYPVEIVARDGGVILLQETRSFVKVGDLPPPGRTRFTLRAGVRVDDSFTRALFEPNDSFFPPITDDLVVNAQAARRIGRSMGLSGNVLFVGDEAYGEAAVSAYFGRVRGSLAGTVGSDGSYGALGTVGFAFPTFSFSLTARSVDSAEEPLALPPPQRSERYFPFLRSEDTVFGTLQFRLLGGAATVSGSYSSSRFLDDRYTLGLRYTRPVEVGRLGVGLFNVFASHSNFESRVGISISFISRINQRTTVSYGAGAEWVDSETGTVRDGLSPIGRAVLTHRRRVGTVDLTSQLGASTDATSDRIFADSTVNSTLGSADLVAQYERDRAGRDIGSLLFNGQSGFAIGGGVFKLGLRQPGDALVLVDIEPDRAEADGPSDPGAGGYRLVVDNQAYDFVRPGTTAAIGLASLDNYRIGLEPEGAPPFELDLTEQPVSLYPGNVVRLRWSAQRTYSLFGQVLDASGTSLAEGRVRAGSDVSVTDMNGYFTITSGEEATLEIRRADGSTCLATRVGDLLGENRGSPLQRIGTLRCEN